MRDPPRGPRLLTLVQSLPQLKSSSSRMPSGVDDRPKWPKLSAFSSYDSSKRRGISWQLPHYSTSSSSRLKRPKKKLISKDFGNCELCTLARLMFP